MGGGNLGTSGLGGSFVGRFKERRYSLTLRRFWKSKMGVLGLLSILSFAFLALLAPVIDSKPGLLRPGERLTPPLESASYLLGTDSLGRNLLGLICWGARSAFTVIISASAISTSIGVVLGLVAAYYGGAVDSVIIKIIDILLCIPEFFLILLAVSMFHQQTLTVVILTLAIFSWMDVSRVVRSAVLSIRELPYVKAARLSGASDARIMFLHILPNALSPIIVIMALRMGDFIMTETGLTFIGLGDPNVISWGKTVNEGFQTLRVAPWVGTFTGLAIFLLTLGFNLLGDGLRDALDVKQRLT